MLLIVVNAAAIASAHNWPAGNVFPLIPCDHKPSESTALFAVPCLITGHGEHVIEVTACRYCGERVVRQVNREAYEAFGVSVPLTDWLTL